MPPPRMTANPKRPSRYRPGKGQDKDSESEYETEEEQQVEQKPKPKAKPVPPTSRVTGAFQEVSLSSLKKAPPPIAPAINEDDFETESEEENDAPPTKKTVTGAVPHGEATTASSDEEEESSEEEEDGSTESSSEDEEPPKLLRPVFIKNNQLSTKAIDEEKGRADARAAQEAETRRKEKADAMIQEQLERNAALKASEKKAWDDSDNEGVEGKTEAEVDDTDGLDPEAELAAWKLRELKRVKRSREQIEQAEKEREEIERRRNLTQEERDAEDKAHLAAQEEEREGKGKAGYMQRYFHKGAFFQDSAYAEEAGLKGRDIMGSRFADEVQNREMLPEFMQIRDMAKLGRKGRTRYKDLRSEDTGRFGDFGRPNDRRHGDDRPEKVDNNIDERFRPDEDSSRKGPSGANATAVNGRSRLGSPPRNAPPGPRKDAGRRRSYSRSRSPERRHDRRDRHRSRSRDDYRRRDRNRSRDRRKRSASPGQYRARSRDREDKRVKVS